MAETRRRQPFNAIYNSGEELFFGTFDGRGVGGVSVLVNTKEVEAFYMDLESFNREDHTFFKVIIGDFNAKIGPRRTSQERHIGTHELKWNEQGERLSEFIMATKIIYGNSQFQKPHPQSWTWEFPNGEYHNEINHIIVNKKFCPTDVAIVPKFCTGSNHRLLRANFYFSRKGEKAAKFKNRSPKTTTNWDLFNSLFGCWEDAAVDNIDEEYDRLIEHLHVSAMKAESSKVTKRRLSPETLELIRQRGIARAAGNRELTSELAKQCRQAMKEDLEERRAVSWTMEFRGGVTSTGGGLDNTGADDDSSAVILLRSY
uniref:Endo/exonuclease/phosphatase domain-containing protein n=1 Tax=Angiostrongylus cantonensis TaxID=6313 RepID=A0A158P944_ANGCA